MAVTWKGNPKLEPLLVPIESITTHPRNPRRGDLPLLAESLDAFGQTRPIVVQPWNPDTLAAAFPGRPAEHEPDRPEWIVAGNHTYRAAVEILAWSHVAVVKPELGTEEYEQYLLMDNRASDASEYDDEVLIPILQRLTDRGDFANTGWDPDQAEDFIAGADRIARTAEEAFQGGYAETDDERQAREKRASGHRTVSQVMLAYSSDEHAEILTGIKMLQREYGTRDLSSTIGRAVDEQFQLVFKETT